MQFRFWLDEDYGIIRQRSAPGLLWHPELWHDGRWYVGSADVVDAITGGSDDGWRGSPTAEVLTEADAVHYAQVHAIDLFGENPDLPNLG